MTMTAFRDTCSPQMALPRTVAAVGKPTVDNRLAKRTPPTVPPGVSWWLGRHAKPVSRPLIVDQRLHRAPRAGHRHIDAYTLAITRTGNGRRRVVLLPLARLGCQSIFLSGNASSCCVWRTYQTRELSNSHRATSDIALTRSPRASGHNYLVHQATLCLSERLLTMRAADHRLRW